MAILNTFEYGNFVIKRDTRVSSSIPRDIEQIEVVFKLPTFLGWLSQGIFLWESQKLSKIFCLICLNASKGFYIAACFDSLVAKGLGSSQATTSFSV